MGTLYPLSRPGRAAALLYPGRCPVFVWYCPYPTLLSTQGKAGWSKNQTQKWGWRDSKKGSERGSPWSEGKKDGPPTSPFLISFPPLQIQVRKAAIASREKADAVYTGLNTRSQETYETLKHEKPPQ
uniref:Uncharacterized protein n=1 Tax=Mus spicilegus TaxID=10103 RepID=A0A8C6I1Q0_MUSSI